MMSCEKISGMSRQFFSRAVGRTSVLVIVIFLCIAGLLAPDEVQAGACDITTPITPLNGTVGVPLTYSFRAYTSSSASRMVISNFNWSNGTGVPGMSYTTNPAAAGSTNSTYYNFSGTPTTAGNYTYTAIAHDNKGSGGCTDVSGTGTIVISAPPALAISPNTIPNGQIDSAYSANLTASGAGAGATYSWSISAGTLPTGLSLNSAAPGTNATISGTPSGSPGDYTFTVRVSSAGFPDGTKNYTITIAPAPLPLSITTLSLPSGQVNLPYSYTVTATGGTPGYTWSLAAGSLPAGLALSAGGGITGTPTAAGTSNLTIRVTDAVAGTTTKAFSITVTAAPVVSTNIANYCITPPFTKQGTLANLLLMIDNSASMYDLTYIDRGASTREPYYCYDQTFNSADADGYPGYFEEALIYRYNDTTFRFETVGAFPGACTKKIPASGSAAHLCLIGQFTTKPYWVTDFYASGKYLNWLSISKFDTEKKVLTGGKYDLGNSALIAESRGCVGRRYLKEANTEDYVEGTTPTSLGITFGIRGPIDPANPSAPSPGGLTEIDIFVGDYNQGNCQAAIEAYQDPACGQQCRRDATSLCLAYDHRDTSLAGKTNNVFIQSVQECYQFDQNGTVGTTDAPNTVKNQCPDVMDGNSPGKCSVTTGTSCTLDTQCPAGERCKVGPFAIEPGNPALLCSSTYTGACYVGSGPYSRTGYTGTIDGHTGDDCIVYMHNRYCGDVKQPPVVDPTDDPSATDLFANVPAILGDVGVQGQLGSPVKSMLVRVAKPETTGSLQDYKDKIRFGALTFNYNGSRTECRDTDLVKCPRICSNDKSKVCTTFQDCPPASPTPTCDLVTSTNMYFDPATGLQRPSQDGGHIISYIGDPTYAANPVGDHSSGLVRAIDDIRAATWTPFSEGFYTAVAYYNQNTNSSDSTKPHRLNDTDFITGTAATPNPVLNACQENYVLLLTDGMSTTDQHADVRALVSQYNDGDGQVTTSASASGSVAPKYFGSMNLDDMAWFAWNKNITNPTSTAVLKNSERVGTFVIYSGEECANRTALGVCTDAAETIPERLMQQTATNGAGLYQLAKKEEEVKDAIETLFKQLSKTAASGTAASVLASGEGSGANLIQAVFYPLREFDAPAADQPVTSAKWLGRLTNLWYFVDPRFTSSGIFEDSTADNELDLTEDNRISLYYDPLVQKTFAHRVRDTNNDGVPDTAVNPDINFEDLRSLWDAGVLLWKRTAPRRILTTLGSGITNFSTANAGTLYPYLQASDATEGGNIINYIHGIDGPYRSRTVYINSLTTDGGSHSGVWKLGDVIQSTPRIASRFPLNTYDQTYYDTTYKTFIQTASYLNRGLVFAGANDGMLHAFYLGKLELDGAWKGSIHERALLSDPSSLGPGKEMWSFIPKNVLPYLKYMTEANYCHIYSVDLTPVIFDVPIGAPADGDVSGADKTVSSWRTILIGGMRLGGGCRPSNDACTNCVKAPGVDLNGNGSIDTDAERTLGMSSYFALDITNTLADPTANPELLWEYSASDLGLTSSGPAIVKIRQPGDAANLKNGKYFVVFGSGPTGNISTGDHQFKGESDQNLKLHIMNLKIGPTGGVLIKTTDQTEAFAGSIMNATLDADLDYQDDVLYIPYVKKCTSALSSLCTNNTWTDGGVGRLLTNEDADPANWTWSTVIDGTGPVTAAVAKLLHQRKGKLWLYFGTGRYFYEQDTPDDAANQRRLYGIKDPCYSTLGFSPPCGSASIPTNVTDIASVPTTAAAIDAIPGWFIDMADSGSGYRAERVITDPLASLTGLVIFTTFQPKDNNCEPGGRSFLWATKYDTGGAGAALLKGKGLLQVSTGSIEEVTLSTSTFTEEGGRKTAAMEGVPPTAQGLSLLASPPPVKRTIHIKER